MSYRSGVPHPGAPWTVKEAAVAQRCTPAHVYDQCAAGELPHTRLGGLVLIPDPVMRERLRLSDEAHEALRQAIAAELAGSPRPKRRAKRRSRRAVAAEAIAAA